MRNRGDLADPDLRPLWQAISVRLSQGDDPGGIRTVRVELTRAGRSMIIGWLSRAPRLHGAPSHCVWSRASR